MKHVFNLFRKIPAQKTKDTAGDFCMDPQYITCAVPKVLWVELTSMCAFDCVFCTRKTRFGRGRHLDFGLYQSLVNELESPEFIGLNYSGESIYYPQLLEAIRLAIATGAATELVTVFSPLSESLIEQIIATGLDRLAVSLHTMDPQQYKDLYRFGSLESLKARIDDFFRIRDRLGSKKPRLDFCFVALQDNLSQLPEVARYALRVGASEVFIHPVIGRHPIPHDFSRELAGNRLQESFKHHLRNAVAAARATAPSVPCTILNPDIDPYPRLGCSPAYFAPELPSGASIHTCDQSPFESVHILSNGDVVICEVLDEMPLGNLGDHSLRDIWHGQRYLEFREKYATSAIAECRNCVWKMAYVPGQWKPAIDAAEGRSPQLLRGWHLGDGETVIWSKRESLLAVRAAGQARRVRIAGLLPSAPRGETNTLRISCNNRFLSGIANPGKEAMEFDKVFRLSPGNGTFHFKFVTDHTFRPALWGINADQRDLGFALSRIEMMN